jgi:hypothetical protein
MTTGHQSSQLTVLRGMTSNLAQWTNLVEQRGGARSAIGVAVSSS